MFSIKDLGIFIAFIELVIAQTNYPVSISDMTLQYFVDGLLKCLYIIITEKYIPTPNEDAAVEYKRSCS